MRLPDAPGPGAVRLALSLLLAGAACSSPDASGPVDPGLVGTWETMIPNAAGVARWVWDVHADGTYAFHAEGPGEIPAHSGTFEARDGKYSLRSTTMVWVDSGTYQLTQPNTLRAAGILGPGTWRRVKPGNSRPEAILAFLPTYPFNVGMLEAPFGSPHTEVPGFDAQAQNDGVIGIVRIVAQSPNGPGTIDFRIYRNRPTAQVSYVLDAVSDSSKRFRIWPGQLVLPKIFTRGKDEGRCISRVRLNVPTATVSCYLLVTDPAEEAVMIVTEFTEPRRGNTQVASDDAFEQASNLLTAGIRYWEFSAIAMPKTPVPQCTPERGCTPGR